MAGGRPSKYDEEMLAMAKAYVDSGGEVGDDAVPTIAGLAVYCGIARDTVYAWASEPEKQEFSDIVEKLMATQEKQLLNGGLRGTLNASITKLALAKHGYTDKQETTLQGVGGGPVQVLYEPVKSDGRRAS